MTEPTKVPVEAKAPEPGTIGPFESLRREIDRVFDSFRSGRWDFPFGRRAFELELPWPGGTSWGIAPAVDLVAKDNEYEITAELPGIDENNIEVKLSNGTLTIKGEKTEEKEEREKDYYLSERRYGSFLRSFQVPEGVDTGQIEATFAKGVLTVKLPKSAEAKRNEKRIAVKVAG
jgi:HSP20 family protein